MMSSFSANSMTPADFPFPAQAGHRLTIAHVEAALSRWRERKPVTLHTSTSPGETLAKLIARMTTRRETTVRWIDLIFVDVTRSVSSIRIRSVTPGPGCPLTEATINFSSRACDVQAVADRSNFSFWLIDLASFWRKIDELRPTLTPRSRPKYLRECLAFAVGVAAANFCPSMAPKSAPRSDE
ncbi:hypothetical protein VSR82_37675 [Burkholderia sp. JPY481]